MWTTHSLWFEISIVMSIFAVGNVLFGHFEEHKPKWKRVAKIAVTLLLVLSISSFFGRMWSFLFLGCMAFIPLVIHTWWLPKNGVHGWTGEPKERYYALIGHTPSKQNDSTES